MNKINELLKSWYVKRVIPNLDKAQDLDSFCSYLKKSGTSESV